LTSMNNNSTIIGRKDFFFIDYNTDLFLTIAKGYFSMNINGCLHKLLDVFTNGFYLLFFIISSGIVLLQISLFGIYSVTVACRIFLMLLFLTLFTDFITIRYNIKISTVYKVFALGIFIVILSYISCCMTFSLPSDTQILYDSAVALVKHGTLDIPYDYSVFYPNLGFHTLSDYYCRYPNNIAMLFILTAIYSIGNLFGIDPSSFSGQSFAVFVTAVSVAIAVHFLCKSAELIFNNKNVYFKCLFLNIIFLSYYYSCPNFYTDVWILFPLCLGFYYAVKFYLTKNNKYIVLCSLSWAIGSQLKITVVIALIAFCIFIIFEKETFFKNKLISLLYLATPFTLFIIAFHAWYNHCSIFDFSRYEELYYPFTVWISYGSHGIGGYHYEDSLLAYHTPFNMRGQVMIDHIKTIFLSYTPAEYMQFLKNKLSFIWGDGLFEGGIYAQWSLFQNWTNRLTNPICREYALSKLWADSYTLILTICGSIASLIQIKKKDNPWLLFINVLITGFILYLCIFEAAPRRAIPAMLFFMLDTIYILNKISNYILQKLHLT